MTSSVWALLTLAGFGAGLLNAIAGGGSFLTFPALVFAGVPPIAANATSAVSLSPGYFGSALGFRAELIAQPRARLVREGIVCALGGVAGAVLLLVTPPAGFVRVVPWLLLFATALFVFGSFRPTGNAPAATRALPGATQLAALFAVAVYGGYFNGGLGILLMALYAFSAVSDVHVANAKKNLHSLVLSLVSVAAFIAARIVLWPQAAAMIVAATVGGFAGAWLGRRLPETWVRGFVVAAGLVMTVVFFRKGR
jgi:uncharacterized protein